MAHLSPLQRVVRLEGWGAQRRLARELGIHESEFSRIVNGKVIPSDATRQRIAEALETQVDAIFDIDHLREAA